jgi:hypothetical protein
LLRFLAFALVCAAAAVCADSAPASQLIDRDATGVKLEVASGAKALLTYRAHGRLWRVRAWGAINARHPNPRVPQVQFRIRRDGKPITNVCGRYSGPPLPWLVKACTAPDGSHWAVQRFRRRMPNQGYLPRSRDERAWALHLSHWTGPLASLEAWSDWSWSGRFHHLFGRLTYRGRPVHGFRTTGQGARLDKYGALVYVDTLRSRYGPGWRRENSFVAHRPSGVFCYTFRARGSRRWAGNGRRYRLTVEGPGVTPDVVRYLDGLPNYNPRNPEHVAHEREMNARQDEIARGDRLCRKH